MTFDVVKVIEEENSANHSTILGNEAYVPQISNRANSTTKSVIFYTFSRRDPAKIYLVVSRLYLESPIAVLSERRHPELGLGILRGATAGGEV